MTGKVDIVRDARAGDVEGVVAEAASVFRAGGLVVLPTETVYGVMASAVDAGAVARLVSLVGGADEGGEALGAWHAPGTDLAMEALEPLHRVHRRLLRRLTPGPVSFEVELADEQRRRCVEVVGVVPGARPGGRRVVVRVPDHAVTRRVLERCGVAVIGRRVGAAGASDERGGSDASLIAGVDLVVDAGRTRFDGASTTVRLESGGGFTVVREGVVSERQVVRRAGHTVLLVCTGNTCRSPMAEAIARDEVERALAKEGGGLVRVVSAGAAARGGTPASPEAVEVLRGQGLDLSGHRSRELTRELVAEADVILGMTRSHVAAVLATDPSAAGKVSMLDPTGGDVPDPIGGPTEVYSRTAEAIRAMIRRRLPELLG